MTWNKRREMGDLNRKQGYAFKMLVASFCPLPSSWKRRAFSELFMISFCFLWSVVTVSPQWSFVDVLYYPRCGFSIFFFCAIGSWTVIDLHSFSTSYPTIKVIVFDLQQVTACHIASIPPYFIGGLERTPRNFFQGNFLDYLQFAHVSFE